MWYECPECGRELTEDQACEGKCRRCGDVVVRLRGKTSELDLNKATKLELIRIAGFGEKAAQYVLAYRRSRKFTSVEELLNVRAVGKKTYEKVRGRLYVEGQKGNSPVMDEQQRKWMLRISDATEWITGFLNKTFRGLWCNLRFEHVDAAAYWYTFELVNDSRRQTWCVRHSDLEG